MREITIQGFLDSRQPGATGNGGYRVYVICPAIRLYEDMEASLTSTLDRIGRELARSGVLRETDASLHKSSIMRRFNGAKADFTAGLPNINWYFSIGMEYDDANDFQKKINTGAVPYYLLSFVGNEALRPAEIEPAPGLS